MPSVVKYTKAVVSRTANKAAGLSKKSALVSVPLPKTSTRRSVSTTTTTTTSVTKQQERKQSSPFLRLPNELLLGILSYLPTQTLATVRSVSRRLKSLSELFLIRTFSYRVSDLTIEKESWDRKYTLLMAGKEPHLLHYRGFLNGLGNSEVTEVSWYASPPQELMTVCECLCILKEGTLRTRGGRLPWPTVKKIMSRYDFKMWLANLREGVERIDMAAVRVVEEIIRSDHSITYERLREVSMPGYKLLIVVAACLQYCGVADELKACKRVLTGVDRRLKRANMFLGYLTA
ncbi:hypothetical protein HK102_004483 [Quaeritorhiza haematococci]|nr:hypothetical protein HK102_004483 [Quaeritorhiza haematococci]